MPRGIACVVAAAALLAPVAPAAPARADSAAGAAGLMLLPAAQSATNGAAVSLTVQLVAASGAQQVSYVVVGRNDGVHGSVSTAGDGTATISYRDHGSAASTATSDTIAVIDAADDESATATVDFIDGPNYAQQVTLDTSGLGIDDSSCGGDGPTPATAIPLARETDVCAAVSNALGEPLAGKPVTFAVSVGSVGPADGAADAGEDAAATRYQATTDRAGVVFAAVTATVPGAQQVSATADHLSGRGSIDYAPPAPEDVAGLTVAPATVSFTAGASRQFVVRAVDSYDNPVAGVALGFTLSGPGSLAAPTAPPVLTSAAGTATATVATPREALGTGAMTARVLSSSAQCPATSCSATAAYTVTAHPVPARLALKAAPWARAGSIELVAAVVETAKGSPVSGEVVHFTVAGAVAAAGVVRSNDRGVALFGYRPRRGGTDRIRAWDDVNRDGRRQPKEPAGFLRLVIAARPRSAPPEK